MQLRNIKTFVGAVPFLLFIPVGADFFDNMRCFCSSPGYFGRVDYYHYVSDRLGLDLEWSNAMNLSRAGPNLRKHSGRLLCDNVKDLKTYKKTLWLEDTSSIQDLLRSCKRIPWLEETSLMQGPLGSCKDEIGNDGKAHRVCANNQMVSLDDKRKEFTAKDFRGPDGQQGAARMSTCQQLCQVELPRIPDIDSQCYKTSLICPGQTSSRMYEWVFGALDWYFNPRPHCGELVPIGMVDLPVESAWTKPPTFEGISNYKARNPPNCYVKKLVFEAL